MKDLFSIVGKVAVVTGGSRGIGAMIARGFLENGAKVYISARKVEELNGVLGILPPNTAKASEAPMFTGL